jgi:hypothetical protein
MDIIKKDLDRLLVVILIILVVVVILTFSFIYSPHKQLFEYDETFVLVQEELRYYGGNYQFAGTATIFDFEVSSNKPVDVYVVHSESDFKLMVARSNEFVYYPECSGKNVLQFKRKCDVDSGSRVVVVNSNNNSPTVNLKVNVIYKS